MSVKKISLLLAASVAAFGLNAALAGGPDLVSSSVAAPAPTVSDSGVYIEGRAGYAYRPWDKYADMYNKGGADKDKYSHNKGGFTGGGEIGYQFDRNLGVEMGGYYLPQLKVTPENGDKTKATSWYLYLAGKLSLPVYDNFKIYGKFGVAFQRVTWDPKLSDDYKKDFWSPYFAVGGQYEFYQGMYVLMEYSFIPSYRDLTSTKHASQIVPPTHSFTGGIGYMFQL